MALRTFTSTFTYTYQHKTSNASKGNRTDASPTVGIIIIDRNDLVLVVLVVVVPVVVVVVVVVLVLLVLLVLLLLQCTQQFSNVFSSRLLNIDV